MPVASNELTDPFSLKRHRKWDPRRLLPTARWRLIELEARVNFTRYCLPLKEVPELPETKDYDGTNTAVTELQARYLLAAVEATERMDRTVIVEIGSFRGATTRLLALATKRQIVTVDPFIGYGGSMQDYEIFRQLTSSLSNVVHIHATSGQALQDWAVGPVSLLFIDSVHDWANTWFDLVGWSRQVTPGGLIALHDTDSKCFAGTRKAAFRFASSGELFAHTPDLTILRRSFGIGRADTGGGRQVLGNEQGG
jgi:predicted O-methyltransferase YrrM